MKDITNLNLIANELHSLQLTTRQLCDLELILNGSFNPLNGYLDKKSYESVIKEMRLSNGSLWPIPITLDVSGEFISKIKNSEKIALRDKEGFALAILNIEDIWKPDILQEASHVFGSIRFKTSWSKLFI